MLYALRQAEFLLPAQYAPVTLAGRRLALWFLPAALGLATAAVFAAGLTAALQGRLGEKVDPSAAPVPLSAVPPAAAAPGGAYRIVALGDSLTRGAGDAAGGGGYPERVAAALRKSGLAVTIENLAVDGSETGDFLRKIEDADVGRRVAAASLILVSIGGNDLSHSMRCRSPLARRARIRRPEPSPGPLSTFREFFLFSENQILRPPSGSSASTTRFPSRSTSA